MRCLCCGKEIKKDHINSWHKACIKRFFNSDTLPLVNLKTIDEEMKKLGEKLIEESKSITGVHTVSEGELEIVEIILSSKAKIVGKQIKEISKPGSFIILLIKEKSEVYKVPDGNTVLDEGDKLVIITKTTSNADILQLFGADE